MIPPHLEAEAANQQAVVNVLAVSRDPLNSRVALFGEIAKAQAAITALAGKTVTITLRPNDPPTGVPAQVGGGPGPLSPGGRAVQPELVGA